MGAKRRNHFPLIIQSQIDAKINAEKIMKNHKQLSNIDAKINEASVGNRCKQTLNKLKTIETNNLPNP